MTPCAHCAQPLAPDAMRCPSCGGTTQRGADRNDRLTVVIVVVLAALGLVAVLVWQNQHADDNECRTRQGIARALDEPVPDC